MCPFHRVLEESDPCSVHLAATTLTTVHIICPCLRGVKADGAQRLCRVYRACATRIAATHPTQLVYPPHKNHAPRTKAVRGARALYGAHPHCAPHISYPLPRSTNLPTYQPTNSPIYPATPYRFNCIGMITCVNSSGPVPTGRKTPGRSERVVSSTTCGVSITPRTSIR